MERPGLPQQGIELRPVRTLRGILAVQESESLAWESELSLDPLDPTPRPADYASVPALPEPPGGVPTASAINTNSRPGRSGASRTSFTIRSALRSESTISPRLRKRSVESEVSTAPSASKTNVIRNETDGRETSVRSVQVSTPPTPGISSRLVDCSRFHSRHPSLAGSRTSNTSKPAGFMAARAALRVDAQSSS